MVTDVTVWSYGLLAIVRHVRDDGSSVGFIRGATESQRKATTRAFQLHSKWEVTKTTNPTGIMCVLSHLLYISIELKYMRPKVVWYIVAQCRCSNELCCRIVIVLWVRPNRSQQTHIESSSGGDVTHWHNSGTAVGRIVARLKDMTDKLQSAYSGHDVSWSSASQYGESVLANCSVILFCCLLSYANLYIHCVSKKPYF